ncbi:MAG TPA: PEP/pyruvate-binding domain-containing protein [Myxococcota bacterium]|nr:PEP/pyruvate-binding domain-containing protein [Myxococcota bacterium]
MSTPLRPTCRLAALPRAVALYAFACAVALSAAASAGPDASEYRRWIEQLKQSPKGPFEAVRWFCADGTVQPPVAYACAEHGGGIQHGLWNDRVQRMRADGYAIANLLAPLDAARFTGADADLDTLKQILLEKFLIEADDGWIFRGARSYRGAIQAEDEAAAARAILLAIAADPRWRAPERYSLLREAVHWLPQQSDSIGATEVRQLAVRIAERDPAFAPLRAKIHNAPDAADAQRVREYVKQRGAPDRSADYEQIAAAIDALYEARGAAETLRAIAAEAGDARAQRALEAAAAQLGEAENSDMRFEVAARLLAELRGECATATSAAGAIALLRASLALEADAFAAGSAVLARARDDSRLARLRWLELAGSALYGAGLIGERQLSELRASVERTRANRELTVSDYREELRYLARAPEWAARWLAFDFSIPAERLSQIEPLARLYVQDRLRASPLLFYGALVDGLLLDANQLAGIEHELFGRKIGAGLRALNPGLARGVLREAHGEEYQRDGIYLLPETLSDLPPVAGILTLGEGSSVSHVQLLARNLGVPNVVVAESLLPSVRSHIGMRAVLAVSPNGVVQLDEDGPDWDAAFGASAGIGGDWAIRPDLEKLDLARAEMIPLDRMRASDSGRSSGPKGANLGELEHYFGDAVPPGFVIPFAWFRRVLDQPLEPGGPPVFEWMKQRYDEIAALDADPALQQRTVRAFLARLRQWIESCDPGPEFRAQLRAALDASFGADGSYGVFIRSDTNIEDLPGFTGAGLNLTVPNVVGFEAILDAIRRVWASPFEERSYGWRQDNMSDPEYVFPAVVVQYSFRAEKSGVMITADVESGDPSVLTVAVNEGVGGAVEGQAAESLRIDARTGETRFLAQATAPLRTELPSSGGIVKRPASGTARLLEPAEIEQLIALSREVARFPSLRDEAGHVLPADVEFAFKEGRLALLQIRPFVQSKAAQRNRYLGALDAGLAQRSLARVDLSGIPQES